MKELLNGKGVVKFSRVNGTQDLYEVINNVGSFIELTISTAKEYESFGETKAMDGKQLIKIALSPVQFASAITQMNMGCGHPCTIENFNGERIEYKKDGVNEFETDVEKALKSIKETMKPSVEEERLIELIKGLRINKETRAELESLINPFVMHRNSNRKFALDRVDELFVKKIARAKGDIQAHAEMMLMNTGILATNKLMNDNMKKLED